MTYQQVVDYFGSAAEAARFFGVSRAAVAQWIETGVPMGRQYELEARTKGAILADREEPSHD